MIYTKLTNHESCLLYLDVYVYTYELALNSAAGGKV